LVHFSKLKLYGFKSFVDKTELEIGPGLNGIVGPNGCGKSNLVEALRWVMGEKSAKNMRGGGMEDVIFAGTSKRPARNMAEVTVVMNNEDGSAPAPFNATTEIEINRRIEKDKGSQYRVNGKAVRARDVNLLFADTMTGANSPALVSQGRITEIISAKPSDRRRILEESAGISGLHTRRHEAELRLRAAEQNLTRLNDSLNDMRNRLSSLKRQARQAERYKELNDAIRRLDLALSWGEWSAIYQKIKTDRQAFAEHNEAVQLALQETKSLTVKVDDLEKNLPHKRKQSMEAQVALQNLRISLERLEQDIEAKAKGLQETLQAQTQLDEDNRFTASQYTQMQADLQQARTDLETTTQEAATLPEQIIAGEKTLLNIQERHSTLTSEKQTLETAIAVAAESCNAIEREVTSLRHSEEKIISNINILEESLTETISKIEILENSPERLINIADFEKSIETLNDQIKKQQTDIHDLQDKCNTRNADKDTFNTDLSSLRGELSGLESLLDRSMQTDMIPEGENALFNHLNVKDGYEKAVSSVLGSWIMMAGTSKDASVYWSDNAAHIPTPNDTLPLLDFIDAPVSLHPFLKSVGYVDTLPPTLPVLNGGQMIVAKDGSFARWDGLVVKGVAANQTDQAGLILEQKNRVNKIQEEINKKQADFEKIDADLDKIEEKLKAYSEILTEQQDKKTITENTMRETRFQQERISDQLTSLAEKHQEQSLRLSQNRGEHTEIRTQLTTLQSQLHNDEDQAIDERKQEIATLTDKIANVSREMDEARQSLANFNQYREAAEQKTKHLQNQIERYDSESQKLALRLQDFEGRSKAIESRISDYKTQNDEQSEQKREELLSQIAECESSAQDVQISLENQEADYRKIQTQLREAEANAALAREHRATAQANVSNSENDLKRLSDDISENFELTPQALEEQVYSLFDEKIPDLTELQNEKDIVVRQRDSIGPVNLRAAIECQETESELATLENEYNDLTQAIEQLRGGIAKLNREAKERLAIAFQRVDLHFQRLFTELFQGGKAYLQMIQSDDPLESGLEIFAQPPGKALQKLSLLSGGEQTLTATALIFAMFLTNPSPICVLDEIDAPLDDANVDRICSLMEKIVEETATRFIVITHHRMTMARMNRLYGVTMGERGVSQLVSVDLAMQEEMDLAENA